MRRVWQPSVRSVTHDIMVAITLRRAREGRHELHLERALTAGHTSALAVAARPCVQRGPLCCPDRAWGHSQGNKEGHVAVAVGRGLCRGGHRGWEGHRLHAPQPTWRGARASRG